MRRAHAAYWGALLSLWAPSLAVARPQISVEVLGECPSAAMVEEQLGLYLTVTTAPRRGAWRLKVASDSGRATFALSSPEGTPSFNRSIESDDCRTVAKAIALVIQAHFIELRLLPPEPATLPVEPRPPPPTPPRSPAPPPSTLSVALSGGVELSPQPLLAAAAFQLEVALRPRSVFLVPRLVLAVSHATEQTTELDRVRRIPVLLRLDAATRFERGRWWLAPTLGVGAVISQVTALDLPGEPQGVRAHPILGLALVVGLRLAPAWSLRGELCLNGHLTRDNYIIEPAGVVAKSPWGSLLATIGLQFDAKL